MDYWFAVTTSANTVKADRIKTELKLTSGVITKVWMLHPEGCHGLAYASVWRGGHQLYPNNPENAYHGNDVPMIWEDNYKLDSPALLRLETWNLDDTYEHTVYVKITVLRPEEAPLARATVELLKAMLALLKGKRVS